MAPPRDLAVRPLGMGEVVDRSIALTLRHFRALFVAMLVLQAPALVLARLQSADAVALLGALDRPERALALLARALPSLALGLVLLLLLQLVATAVAAAVVAPSLDPRPGPRPGPARRAGAVASAAALHLVALLAAPALGAAPGALLAARAGSVGSLAAGLAAAVAGGVVAFVIVLLRLVLAPAAAAVEARGGLAALRRSSRLMAPAPGARLVERPGLRASLVLLATFALAVAVNGLAGLPRAVAARATGAGALALLGAGLPAPLEVALSAFEAAAGAALQPFSLVAVAVLYFERRARREGLDLEIWAGRLELGQGATGPRRSGGTQ